MQRPNPQTTDRLDWALVVGRIVLAFSGIELMLMEILVHISPDNKYKAFRCAEFLKKANGARVAVETSQLKTGQRRRLARILGKVITNAKWRNLLAHTPVRPGLFDGASGIDFRPEARSIRNQDVALSFTELIILADEVEGI